MNTNRFLIAGTSSGCGKTTVTCAVLAALKARGIDTAAFKCGPDYIDPMFHRSVLGLPSHNLDGFFCNDETLRGLLGRYSRGTTVIEGVMGFYDGGAGSAYSLSLATDTPVVIVIGCNGMSDSIGAVMSGFLGYRKPNNIAGFIFNRLPTKLIPLAQRLCEELDTEYFGCLPKNEFVFESRHLGLVTAEETERLREKLDGLGKLAGEFILIDKLTALQAPEYMQKSAPKDISFSRRPVIAVAKDKAFCFIYQESIELLEDMSCRIEWFSPLADSALPEADGLILSGGYPELYAAELSANTSMLKSVREHILSGMPTIAECGGFMYLHEELSDGEKSCKMAGVISGKVFKTERLQRFGYFTMTAKGDGLICESGDTLKAHEFHYWESTNCGDGFTAEKTNGARYDCCHHGDTLYAGFPHIYLYADRTAAERFVKKCITYGEKHGQD
ncbi:MAG: cobyrinate a,c-diamide synthase [Ruminococcus sp.]|nr:cobyrinate a,c-diamide synthase [Ruminococcus sp.]